MKIRPSLAYYMMPQKIKVVRKPLAEIRAIFGDAVAEIVAPVCQRDQALPADQRYATASLRSLLFDYRALGPVLWDRFNGGADGTRWYYGELSSFFAGTIPGRLSDRLSRAVQGFSD